MTDVTSTDIRCNVGGTVGISGKCAVTAGQIVTVEMHQVWFIAQGERFDHYC